ncbi:helix-turn-helix domain-containing protein [Paenibacillus melissococcoides]|uniref:Helix-turn-helix domain-containing protein n=1 Tax=Paenibacillus melissococcoides TaxID=2912268 RepID=A0ABM9GA09_9BACL|nr:MULTISPECIES: MerR family transcriptional regulator [Paenibacillus]GIO81880.1 hypothetical protein J6TS7_54900 [Paenibacillus dendritiformis]CAH8248511.1 helix-turn-helix domain-containing protein [Paenibacillus melissococcoides]CAH8722006.1 helix-turn-helix domain-containing protein [Paenibacillus melissococcoides]CAH8722054.1 helix-turn-helix domain-containing protein [Paenibacillus melissococcoides]
MGENLGKNLCKMNEAAMEIGESPHVVREWHKKLRNYIPTKKGDNGYNYFDEEALDVLRFIQRLIRDQNYSLRQVEHALASGNIENIAEPDPVAATVEVVTSEPNEATEQMAAAAQVFQGVMHEMERMRAEMEELKKVNQAMHERNIQTNLRISEVLREVLETKQLMLQQPTHAQARAKRWYEFWKRED